ncbi:MAG: hypothetical protein A2073_01565 [Deltaproteobacteria bacterium GWC2_42_11]|nr:MAG: hypothetical protein A2073_01565 [Deltaproteobacteria bacterium GWC2_42_11]
MMPEDAKTLETLLKFERNYAVSAGAGSGKTSALVGLYIKLVEEGISLKKIVAITFTEKAAGELKERIEKEIGLRVMPAPAVLPSNGSIGGSKQGGEGSPRLAGSGVWLKAMQDISSAPIGTFHTICARMLRENAVEAGITPDFRIMDENESLMALQDVVRKTIINSAKEGSSGARYWIKSMGNSRRLADPILKIYQNIRNHGLEMHDVGGLIRGEIFLKDAFLRNILNLFDCIDNKLQNGFENGGVTGEKTRKYFEAFFDTWQKINNGLRLLDVSMHEEAKEIIDRLISRLPKSSRGVPDSLKKDIYSAKNVLNGLKEITASYRTVPHIRDFVDLLKLVDLRYSEIKDKNSSLDFQDLLNLARKMLTSSRDVRGYYKKAFKKILVDEFQDTNGVQASIVYLMAEKDDISMDTPSINSLADSKLVIVGDMKQSIYGFRGADVKVFGGVIKNFDRSSILYLENNRRSCRGIVSFVNALFIDRKGCGHDGIIFSRNAMQRHTRDEDNDFGEDARVEFILFGKGKSVSGGAEAVRKMESDAIAKRVLQIVGSLDVVEYNHHLGMKKRKAGFGDIALLFRTLNDVGIYEDALRRLNIPYYIVRGSGFYHCQEVLDIYNVLQHIERGDSDIYLAGVLRSPFVGLMDETLYRLVRRLNESGKIICRKISEGFYNEKDFRDYPEEEAENIIRAREWLIKWKSVKDRLTIAELIETILADTGYLAGIISTFQGEQKVANVKKLIEAARRFESEGNATIRDFTYHLKKLFDEPPREAEAQITTEKMDVVKIMTVHQAKGLEFPIVFVPDIGRGLPAIKDRIVFSPCLGVAAKYINEDGADEETSVLRSAREDIKEMEMNESMRIFYVACTRARDYLILSGESSKKCENWRGVLDAMLDNEVNDFLKDGVLDAVRVINTNGSNIKLLRGDILADENRAPEAVPDIIRHGKMPHDVIKDIFDFNPPLVRELVIPATELAEFMTFPEKFKMSAVTDSMDAEFSRRERARDIGTFFHLIMERLDYHLAGKDAGYVTFLINDIAGGMRISDRETNDITVDVLRYIESKTFREVLDAREVYREFPFFMPVRENGFTLYVKGVVDLLYLAKNGIWKVIDYKYASQEGEETAVYENQIKIYSAAVSDSFGSDAESAILFMKGGQRMFKTERFDIESFKKHMLETGKVFAGQLR